MSHFTRIKTKITDLNTLAQALQEMGFTGIKQAAEDTLTINGVGSSYMGSIVATGDFEVQHWSTRSMMNVQRQFGFGKNDDGTYTLHMDPWGLGATFMEGLRDKIQQRYAAVVAKNNLMAQGFVMTEEVTEDGEIHMTLVRV